jgi:hypothetical protein
MTVEVQLSCWMKWSNHAYKSIGFDTRPVEGEGNTVFAPAKSSFKGGHPANSGSFAAQLAIVLLPGTAVTVGPARPKGKGPNPNPAW